MLHNGFEKMKNTDEHLTTNSLANHAQSSKSTRCSFLRHELSMFPYKITYGQILTEEHKQMRRDFSDYFFDKTKEGKCCWTISFLAMNVLSL